MTNTPQVPQVSRGKQLRGQVPEGLRKVDFLFQCGEMHLKEVFVVAVSVICLFSTQTLDPHKTGTGPDLLTIQIPMRALRGQNTWTSLTFLARPKSPGK